MSDLAVYNTGAYAFLFFYFMVNNVRLLSKQNNEDPIAKELTLRVL